MVIRRSTYRVEREFIADLYHQEEGCFPLPYPIPVGADVRADLDSQNDHSHGRTPMVEFRVGSALYYVSRQIFISSTRPAPSADQVEKGEKPQRELWCASSGYSRGDAEGVRNGAVLSCSTYRVAHEFIAYLYQQEEGCAVLPYPIPVGAKVRADLAHERAYAERRTELVEFGVGSILYRVPRQTFVNSTNLLVAPAKPQPATIAIEATETAVGYAAKGYGTDIRSGR